MQITFKTARGNEVRLTLKDGNVYAKGGPFDHRAVLVQDATHGASILVKHGYNETLIPMPAAVSEVVAEMFAAADAYNVKAAASLHRKLAADAEYDAHHAKILRAMEGR
jgi:hypothetical protein